MQVLRVCIIAKKLGMSQLFSDNGVVTPVTVMQIDPNAVVQIKTNDKDGYNAVRVAAFDQKPSRMSKSVVEMYKKHGIGPKRISKEFRVDADCEFAVGDKLGVECFYKGMYLDISGISKGKGFAGPMKRWNFCGLEASHGVSVSHRSHGSTGQCQDPGRVKKGQKMAGRYGGEKITVQNVKVIDIDENLGVLVVKGAVPGCRNNIVYLMPTIKKPMQTRASEVQVVS